MIISLFKSTYQNYYTGVTKHIKIHNLTNHRIIFVFHELEIIIQILNVYVYYGCILKNKCRYHTFPIAVSLASPFTHTFVQLNNEHDTKDPDTINDSMFIELFSVQCISVLTRLSIHNFHVRGFYFLPKNTIQWHVRFMIYDKFFRQLSKLK